MLDQLKERLKGEKKRKERGRRSIAPISSQHLPPICLHRLLTEEEASQKKKRRGIGGKNYPISNSILSHISADHTTPSSKRERKGKENGNKHRASALILPPLTSRRRKREKKREDPTARAAQLFSQLAAPV